jgi:hypothetical protein
VWLLAATTSFVAAFGVGSRRLADHLWLDIHLRRTPQIDVGNIVHHQMPLGQLVELPRAGVRDAKGRAVQPELRREERRRLSVAQSARHSTGLELHIAELNVQVGPFGKPHRVVARSPDHCLSTSWLPALAAQRV